MILEIDQTSAILNFFTNITRPTFQEENVNFAMTSLEENASYSMTSLEENGTLLDK